MKPLPVKSRLETWLSRMPLLCEGLILSSRFGLFLNGRERPAKLTETEEKDPRPGRSVNGPLHWSIIENIIPSGNSIISHFIF